MDNRRLQQARRPPLYIALPWNWMLTIARLGNSRAMQLHRRKSKMCCCLPFIGSTSSGIELCSRSLVGPVRATSIRAAWLPHSVRSPRCEACTDSSCSLAHLNDVMNAERSTICQLYTVTTEVSSLSHLHIRHLRSGSDGVLVVRNNMPSILYTITLHTSLGFLSSLMNAAAILP